MMDNEAGLAGLAEAAGMMEAESPAMDRGGGDPPPTDMQPRRKFCQTPKT